MKLRDLLEKNFKDSVFIVISGKQITVEVYDEENRHRTEIDTPRFTSDKKAIAWAEKEGYIVIDVENN